MGIPKDPDDGVKVVTKTTYQDATLAIAKAEVARAIMEGAYTEAYDEFAEVKKLYQKFSGTEDDPADVVGLVKKFAPMALKYFGAGGAGAGVLLALSQDGTGAGILSRVAGLFGFGGP